MDISGVVGRGQGRSGSRGRARRRAGWRADGPIIVNSSRAILYASNGADFAAAARREGLDVELHIVGPLVDVDAGSLERMSGECGIADVVHLHGAVADPLPFFAHASVALLTSEIEGLPGVLLESLSCGTPAVSTALPGALEIAARTAGVTCVALDAPDSIWVDAIRQARTDSRADIRSAFAASPFRVNRYVDDILSLWGVDA